MGQNSPLRTNHRPAPAPAPTPTPTPARVAGAYLLFGLLWIGLSDRVLLSLGIGPVEGFWAAVGKGAVFVGASAVFVYWFVGREVRALTRTLALLRAVTDGTTDAVFVKDREGRYLFINRAGADLIGRPVPDILGLSDAVLFEPVTAERLSAQDRAVVALGAARSCETAFPASDGPRTFSATKAPYRDASGAVLGVIGVSREITDHKRAEAERLAHLRFFECMDRVNQVLQGSDELERVLRDVLDVVLSELECDRVWLVHPCDPEAPAWSAPMERTRAEYPGAAGLNREIPTDAEVARVFRTVLGADGPVSFGPGGEHPLPAGAIERFGVRSQLALVLRPSGGRPWVFGLHQCSHPREWSRADERLFREIGRRLAGALNGLLATRDLRASQRQHQELVATIDGIVWEVDPRTFRFTFVSDQAERLLGYPVARWAEPDFWTEHMHPGDRDWALNYCLGATREHRNHDFEYRMLAADGRVVWVRDLVTVVVEDGAVASIRGVMVDVTARKRAEEFQGRQNRVLERIATGCPLADALAAVVQLVEDELPGTAGSVLLLDRDGRLRHGAAPSLPPEYSGAVDGVAIGPAVGSCGTAAFIGAPVLVNDVATDPRWDAFRALALGHGLRACWSVPILGTQRGALPRPVLGTFAVYARGPGAPPPRFMEVLGRAEHLARVAIESDRADRALRESEGRYRALVETSADGIFVNRGGRIGFANAALARMLGADAPERLIGMDALDLVHPDWHAASRAAAAALRDTGRPLLLARRRFVRFDGGWVDTELNAAACEDQGEWAVYVTVRDVTDRERAAAALRASEERYRETVEAAPDAIVTTDARGTVVGWNRGAERVFGWTAGEAVGRDAALFVPARHAAAHRAALAAFDPANPGRGRGRAIEATGVRKDGTEVPVEIALAHWGAGADRRFTAIIRDVTARKRAETVIHEREEQLRLFVDQVWAAIALVDRDMRYVYTSRRWRTDFGLGDRDLTGVSHYDVFPDVPERWKQVHRRCLAGAEERCDEDRFDRADGTVQWLRWEVRPWRRADGTVAGLVTYSEDITARKRMEAHYQQALKMEAVGQLAGGIAHDFNNLLTVINGFSDLALRAAGPADPHRDALTEIRAAGGRAARLTQQLLAYSRKAMIEPTVLDLNELVTEAAKMIRLVGEHVLVAQALAPGPVRVRADRGQLEQVLLNLVVNARDAMPGGGRLTIETRSVGLGPGDLPDDPDVRPGRYVELSVADTGVGMSEEVRAKIFEPFFTTKEVGKGTGLGLAMVHGAVKQNGGHIRVASAAGAGTTFTVLLPAFGGPDEAPAGGPPPAARGAETVLLVEDEGAVRAITRRALEEYGYTVLAADGGPAALALIDRHPGPLDLLVTDVVMPHLGGRELAEALRRRRPGLRVLFISGYTDDVVLRHGLSAGSFLQKPYSPDALAGKVRELLDQKE